MTALLGKDYAFQPFIHSAFFKVAVGETVILLHPPPALACISIGMEI